MSLADRIERLEQRARARRHPAAERDFPVLVIACDDDEFDDPEKPYVIEHEGMRWEQRPDEAFDRFQDRATDEAVRLCKPPGRGEVLILSPMRSSSSVSAEPRN